MGQIVIPGGNLGTAADTPASYSGSAAHLLGARLCAGVPCIGKADYAAALNTGEGGLSIVAFANHVGYYVDATEAFTLTGNVIFSFLEFRSSALPDTPIDGYALYHHSTQLRLVVHKYINETYPINYVAIVIDDTVPAGTSNQHGLWKRYCLTKKAGAGADADWKGYVEGSQVTTGGGGLIISHSGQSIWSPGAVAAGTPFRLFHRCDWNGQPRQFGASPAGFWVFNTELTPTQGQNLTNGTLDAEDATLLPSLIARAYLGVPDWTTPVAPLGRVHSENEVA